MVWVSLTLFAVAYFVGFSFALVAIRAESSRMNRRLMLALWIIAVLAFAVGLPLALWGQGPEQRRGPFRPLQPVTPGPQIDPAPPGSAQAHRTDGPVARDGTVAQIDWPVKLWRQNEAGNDGKGLCVYRSFANACIWHGLPQYAEIFEWMRQRPGGSYPAKFAKDFSAFCREKGLPEIPYMQIQSSEMPLDSWMDLVEQAERNGHMVCTTYSYSPTGRYGGKRTSHMVNFVAANGAGPWAFMDNNYNPQFEWCPRVEAKKVVAGGGSAWAIIILLPGPPPVPIL